VKPLLREREGGYTPRVLAQLACKVLDLMVPISHRIESVDDDLATILRTKSPAERLRIASGMWAMARDVISGALRSEHPDWSEEQIRKAVARRLSHGAV
jgi:hypothetical protein